MCYLLSWNRLHSWIIKEGHKLASTLTGVYLLGILCAGYLLKQNYVLSNLQMYRWSSKCITAATRIVLHLFLMDAAKF